MTLFEPTIIVERMRVERNSHVAYDEMFHAGVNVIRGDNSSGKSTILNFIFFGLGGDLSDWSSAARLCTRVLVQARINDKVATLAREVSTKPRRGMDIFGGTIEEALSAPQSEWFQFGYARGDSRESFSQALFRLMNMPEVVTDVSGNITMNQLLRLLYADQLSPIEQLFKYQGMFDNGDLRDAVGRLLFGSNSVAHYENEQEIRRLGKELDQVIGEYRSLLVALGSEDGVTWEWVQAERHQLSQRARELTEAISEAEQMDGVTDDSPTLRAQETAREHVVQLQVKIAEARDTRNYLALKIADSARFIESLREKLQALNDTSLVATVIGDVRFNECPACNTPLDEESSPHSCYLCKSVHSEEAQRGRIAAMVTETALQIDQSEQLQRSRVQQASALDETIRSLTREWELAAADSAELRTSVNSERQLRLRELNREAGYVRRQLDDLSRKEEFALRLQGLSDRRSELQARIEELKSTNEALEREQVERLNQAATVVSDCIRTLLKNDLKRQDIFENPSAVSINFRDNSLSINDERYFSASSRAILKSSFVLALLEAATKLSFMRHPRFCMIDTLENMGVEAVRSQNFQRQILRVSSESKVDHQIIFATAMLADDLDDAAYVVGRHYTMEAPSLAIAVPASVPADQPE